MIWPFVILLLLLLIPRTSIKVQTQSPSSLLSSPHPTPDPPHSSSTVRSRSIDRSSWSRFLIWPLSPLSSATACCSPLARSEISSGSSSIGPLPKISRSVFPDFLQILRYVRFFFFPSFDWFLVLEQGYAPICLGLEDFYTRRLYLRIQVTICCYVLVVDFFNDFDVSGSDLSLFLNSL